MFTDYEDTKDNANVENGWFRVDRGYPTHRQHNHSIQRIGLPIQL